MKHPDYEYDEIADKVFFPIYDRIAGQIVEATGIKTGKMLDIGCGGGHLGFAVMEKTELEGYFADMQDAPIEIARMRAEERGLRERSHFYIQDVHELSFEDDFADLIISRGSYFFWEDQEKAFRELYRVLAPGGMIYIGAGLGSKEQRKAIHEKMDEIYGGWESPRTKPNYGMTTDEYIKMFESFGWEHSIRDDDEGRWFMIRKRG